jgi:hypothetical protein
MQNAQNICPHSVLVISWAGSKQIGHMILGVGGRAELDEALDDMKGKQPSS